jgi:hypothetical protein
MLVVVVALGDQVRKDAAGRSGALVATAPARVMMMMMQC